MMLFRYMADIVARARHRLGWEGPLIAKDMPFIQSLIDYSCEPGYINKRLRVEQLVDRRYLAGVQ